jgi:RimJ/RimL family protein N-acetyltransferase
VIPTLETARLILCPVELADARQIQAIFPHWDVVKYLAAGAVPWPYPEEGALTYIRDIALPAMARGEEWVWTLRERSNPGQVMGLISLTNEEDNHRGFWLGVPFRGRGFMTEAVEAATDYWFGELRRPLLRAPKAVANEGSRKISQRTGMRLVATMEREYVSGRLPAELWEITAEEWAVRRGTSISRRA